MSIAKEITTGFIVIGLVSIIFLGIAQEYSSKPRLGGSEVENVQENSTSQRVASWWDNHDLHAVPGLENASVEDLPTAEEVENILFEWDDFDNYYQIIHNAVVFDWIGSREGVLQNVIEPDDLEYHYDEESVLHIDTPGVVFEVPSERSDDQYYISNFNSNDDGSENGYGNVVGALNFCRHLDNLGLICGIAGFIDGTGSHGKVVTPMQEGLMYLYPIGGEHGHSFSENWTALNSQPGDWSPWWDPDYIEGGTLMKIRLHWRLGEGEYVSWLYKLENGEPVMTWLDNGEPVDW